MNKYLANKFIISGHSRGIGKAVADYLPSRKVIGISRTAVKDIYYGSLQLDISNYRYAKRALELYIKELKETDKLAVILCAGTLGKSNYLLESNLQDWENVIRTNLLGNLAIIQACLPNMIRNNYGRIIFLAGGGAAYGYPIFSAYALSKTAIVRQVENTAMEFANKIDDFSIIALAPGAIETEMLRKVRAAGAKIKTTADISEPVEFIDRFLRMDRNNATKLSGKFIHVRDNLESEDLPEKWLLRRIQ